MKLFKMLAYGFLFWGAYQLIRGMMGEAGGEMRNETQKDSPGRAMNMTGAGVGQRVETADSQGTSVPHIVGRGVVTS